MILINQCYFLSKLPLKRQISSIMLLKIIFFYFPPFYPLQSILLLFLAVENEYLPPAFSVSTQLFFDGLQCPGQDGEIPGGPLQRADHLWLGGPLSADRREEEPADSGDGPLLYHSGAGIRGGLGKEHK